VLAVRDEIAVVSAAASVLLSDPTASTAVILNCDISVRSVDQPLATFPLRTV
jgi:hypothetical protein